MGYQNSSTIVVDAILTKHGRKVLGQGNALDITQFALADDGISYFLYNSAHPSGSDSFGEAITTLPQLESVPDNTAEMKYKLMTMPQGETFLPYIAGLASTNITLTDTGQPIDISPSTVNGSDANYTFTFTSDASVVVTNATRVDAGPALQPQSYHTEVPASAHYVGSNVTIEARTVKSTQAFTIRITGNTTGAVEFVDVTVNANQRTI